MTKITAPARTVLFAALAAFALAGCAAKPDPNSFGGRLALEGGETAAIGKEWNDAKADVAEGRDLIEDGQSKIRKGEKQIASGEDNIDDGKAMISKGERLILDGERRAAAAEARYNARNLPSVQRPPVL